VRDLAGILESEELASGSVRRSSLHPRPTSGDNELTLISCAGTAILKKDGPAGEGQSFPTTQQQRWVQVTVIFGGQNIRALIKSDNVLRVVLFYLTSKLGLGALRFAVSHGKPPILARPQHADGPRDPGAALLPGRGSPENIRPK
jgi:hypothetical protein